jgi:hypothetical protein
MSELPKQSTLEQRNDLAIREATEQAFCKRHGYLVPRGYSWSNACAHLIRREQCPKDSRDCDLAGWASKHGQSRLLVWDHISVYVRIADGRSVIISQPYSSPGCYETVTPLVKSFAERWGLYFAISNEESWYRPGHTLLIELSPLPSQKEIAKIAKTAFPDVEYRSKAVKS